MEALEVRCSNLEQQLSQVLNHLGSSTGDLFASQNQVSQLDSIIKQQQYTIDNLQATQTFFQKQFPEYIDEQVREAMNERGSRGSDYINITKFISSHLGHALTALQNHCTTILKEAPIKPKTRYNPEIHQNNQSNQNNQSDNSVLISLQLRLKQLEENQIQPIQYDTATITELKEHIHHLETNLLEEVQRAYRTVYKPGEYGAPLTKLQSTVELLNREFQNFRGLDVKKLTETMIATAHQTFREEIETRLETRASHDQLQKFESTVYRVESFSKDVQTGFHAMKQHYQSFEEELSKKFSVKAWSALEEKAIKLIHSSLEAKQEEFTQKLQSYVATHYTTIRTEFQALKQSFLELTSEIKTELKASELQKRYKKFEDSLELQIANYKDLETQYTTLLTSGQLQNQKLEESMNTTLQSIETYTANILSTQEANYTKLENQYKTFERNQTTSIASIKSTIKVLEDSIRVHMHQIEDTNKSVKTHLELQQKCNTMTSTIESSFAVLQKSVPIKVKEMESLLEESINSKIQQLDAVYSKKQIEFQTNYTSMTSNIETSFNKLQRIVPAKVKEMESLLEESINSKIQQLDAVYSKKQSDFQTKYATTILSIEETMNSKIQQVDTVYNKKQLEFQSKYKTMTTNVDSVFDILEHTVPAKVKEMESFIQKTMDSKIHQLDTVYSRKQLEFQTKYKTMTTNIESMFTVLQNAVPTKVKDMETLIQDSIRTKISEIDATVSIYMKMRNNKAVEYEKTHTARMNKLLEAIQTIESQTQGYFDKTSNALDSVVKQSDSSITKLETKYKTTYSFIENMLEKVEGVIKEKVNLLHKRIDTLYHAQSRQKSLTYSSIQQYASLTKCFYTAIIGKAGQAVDILGPFERIDGWDYICFTNQPIKNPYGWTIVQVDYKGNEPALEAKKYKWLSHTYLEDYEVVVWMDAYIAPNPSRDELLQTWILTMKEKDVQILHKTHPERKCVWDECEAVVTNKRDTEQHASSVRSLLHSIRMPKEWGLFDTCILIKMNKNIELQTYCESIYEQLCKTSVRDQLAVTPIYYKNGYTKYSSNNLMNAFEIVGNHIRISV